MVSLELRTANQLLFRRSCGPFTSSLRIAGLISIMLCVDSYLPLVVLYKGSYMALFEKTTDFHGLLWVLASSGTARSKQRSNRYCCSCSE